VFAGTAFDTLNHYKSPISDIITKVIVWSNYFPYGDECNNQIKGGWISVLSESKISVAIPNGHGGYTFQARVCDKENSSNINKIG
jgi:hypothetical protein